jgi:GT2 family glycosyltransferase
MKGLSIVIPNYNGKHLFEKYFAQNLEVFKTLTIPFEIIVVDDGSKDDSLVYLNENYLHQIQIIAKKINSGFSNTCNQGIKAAKYDLVFLLNTDVLLTPNYFDRLFKYFDDENTFGVMGRIIGINDDIIQDAARLPKLFGRKIKPTNFYYLDDENEKAPTLYLSGAIALIDAKKIKTLGGFNELFSPFYGEDAELCLRAWRMGWKCFYEHQAICRHEISGSTKNYQKKYWIKTIYFRNRYFLHVLHLNGLDLLLWHFQVIFSDIIPSIITFKTYKLKAYIQVFVQLVELKKKKVAFEILMKKQGVFNSILDVITIIKSLLIGKKITRI